MAKNTLSPKKIEQHLLKKKKAAHAIARKIAIQPDILTTTKATRTLNSMTRELEKIQEAITIDPNMHSHYVNQLVDFYISTMKKHFPNAKTKFRREEIFIAIVTGAILEYYPDTKPAYLGGDKLIEDRVRTDIQIKSPTDVFRIFYDIPQMKKQMKEAGFPVGTIEAAVDAASREYTYSYKDLTSLKGKLDFMKRYQKISQANWYLLFFDNISNYTAVGFPAAVLLKFVRAFRQYFVPVFDDKQKGLYALKLQLTYNSGFHLKVWSHIVSAQSVIHYREEEDFYKDRNNHMDIIQRQAYNKVFWSDNYHRGNLQIQNSIFAPIKYKGKR